MKFKIERSDLITDVKDLSMRNELPLLTSDQVKTLLFLEPFYDSLLQSMEE
ncbi:hypothetical protein [Chlamydia caviae]|uniref:Uncharacterized protein n=1 Tax=Chlamydia caviae (strain ATCC VR-813 / DSM 19441 / 03DC25 / GPIC) TaxID=227941 RepID=Q822V8_CHLCV|nr:hypothetical protein [Chlamydia caviae]AAP05313.1 hypothetical protein CCA_00571 [Chlamydia caviae GPIC]